MTPENRKCLEKMLEEGGPEDGAFDLRERKSLYAALDEIDSLTARVKDLEGRLASEQRETERLRAVYNRSTSCDIARERDHAEARVKELEARLEAVKKLCDREIDADCGAVSVLRVLAAVEGKP